MARDPSAPMTKKERVEGVREEVPLFMAPVVAGEAEGVGVGTVVGACVTVLVGELVGVAVGALVGVFTE